MMCKQQAKWIMVHEDCTTTLLCNDHRIEPDDTKHEYIINIAALGELVRDLAPLKTCGVRECQYDS